MSAAVNILLRRPPGPDSDFVEVETDDGHSVSVGEWTHHPDGLWALRITPKGLTILHEVPPFSL